MTSLKLLFKTGKYLSSCLILVTLFGFPISSYSKEVSHKFNGLTINANLEMAEGKGFEDGIVLILHGLGGHNKMEVIRSAQQVLLDNEHSSLAINLSLSIDNRHGFFDCSLPQRHIQNNAILELSAWVAWLRERGTTRVTLIGHSRGANQMMVYVEENRDPEVSHLVMMAPGLGNNDVRKNYYERYGYNIDNTLSLAYKQISSGKGDDLMKGIDTLPCPKASVTANHFVSYYSVNNKFRDYGRYLSKIAIPTLIITGTEDERQPDIVKLMKPYTFNQNILVSEIEFAGHFFRDLNMEEAMETVIEFIDE